MASYSSASTAAGLTAGDWGAVGDLEHGCPASPMGTLIQLSRRPPQGRIRGSCVWCPRNSRELPGLPRLVSPELPSSAPRAAVLGELRLVSPELLGTPVSPELLSAELL